MYHQLVKVGCYALIAMSAMVSSGAQAANSRPVAYSAKLTLQEDVRTTIQLRATDANRDALTYNIVKAPQYGTITQVKDKPTLLYVPHINYAGSDTVTFTANDGKLTSAVATINLTIKAVNDAPEGVTQNLKTNQNTALPLTLRATDVENDRLTYRINQSPTNGTLSSISGASLRYTPKTGYVGTDSFLFIAKDASKNSTATSVTITVSKPTLSGRLLLLDPTQNNAELGISQVAYTIQASQGAVNQFFQSIADFFGYQSSTSNTATTGSTSSNGSFSYLAGDNISIQLAGKVFTLPAKAKITQYDLATAACNKDSVDTNQCIYTTNVNLTRLLLNADDDQTTSNGIQPSSWLANNTWVLNNSIDEFETRLGRYLAAYGIVLKPIYHTSLGINTEAPQAEQDSIIQSVPFADLFRIARPFKDLSCASTTYDAQGWPTSAPTNTCAIRTTLLNGAIISSSLPNAAVNNRRTIPASRYTEVVPEGRYTVLYEGEGTLVYGNYAQLVSRSPGRDLIDIKFTGAAVRLERMDLSITVNNVNNPIKNIRIAMPGGVCEGNPFVRVANADGCPAGKYQAFANTLANRNAIVFNPDYLNFMKDFRVVRMMNLMEASPRNPCTGSGDAYNTCLLQDFTWAQRAKLTDATWGGSASANNPLLQRYGRGAPLEVQVALANQLKAHPWFNIPHNATDEYVTEFANYVRTNLNTGLKAHIEYTNEAWNYIFWGSLYARKKGMDLGLGSAFTNQEYWAGALYYAKRATEIFKLWETAFNDNSRLVRILGTVQTDIFLTRNMLNYLDTKDHVDAVATNAYFYACLDRTSTSCSNTTTIPKTLNEVTTVDEVFAAIDNANDPNGLPKLQINLAAQATEVARFGKALYAYEGGQHLTVDGNTDDIRRNVFEAANRDPRMGERYTTLLNGWKTAGGQQFMLYTQPQSFHKWGLFAMKETLLQPRYSTPKYDAAMKFQETQGKCWWNGC